jgi:DNA-binding PadR family transcriptional regulator
MAPDPASLLPLSPHDFQVLLVLADGPRHAYGLAQAVEDAEEGGVRLELGSLYRILARLTTQGVIADDVEPCESSEKDARRRYYRLTPFGRRVAQAETARLQGVLAMARRRALAPGKTRP